jgi:hypothetical protein
VILSRTRNGIQVALSLLNKYQQQKKIRKWDIRSRRHDAEEEKKSLARRQDRAVNAYLQTAAEKKVRLFVVSGWTESEKIEPEVGKSQSWRAW